MSGKLVQRKRLIGFVYGNAFGRVTRTQVEFAPWRLRMEAFKLWILAPLVLLMAVLWACSGGLLALVLVTSNGNGLDAYYVAFALLSIVSAAGNFWLWHWLRGGE